MSSYVAKGNYCLDVKVLGWIVVEKFVCNIKRKISLIIGAKESYLLME